MATLAGGRDAAIATTSGASVRGASGAPASSCRKPPLPVRRHEGGASELVKRHREHLGLERDAEFVARVRGAAERLVEDLDGPPELAARGERAAEIERDLGAQKRILGQGNGRAQV